ncbi:GrpB family protein [Paenibacillus rigui]|uniref:GrpB family protein n=1 Tax=Paenibacillus rigui TaxID=554312 RepID=A0A229UH28_9BACL|nr:GrpB family protein [Paenibacillus rigui]OXM82703.1 hypothetical protein CF651_28950 [Paenibacillus rigui]
MIEPILVVPYSDNWAAEFTKIGALVRHALGSTALRIDHIGSTSVKGLHAKPIVDIQISVEKLEPSEQYKAAMESIGFNHRADNPDLSKRYFRESPGHNRTHIHVRQYGSLSEQFALLFRDYLRAHPVDCERYACMKLALAELYRYEREKYVDAKEPIIWDILRKASRWSQLTGWRPAASDM